MRTPRPLLPGVYVPTLAFFHPSSEDVDIETTKLHATNLAQSNSIAGLVPHGSNGEIAHLSSSERSAITRATREALDAAGKPSIPVIAGCGAHSTRETIQNCREAYESGADYALVLSPSYFSGLYSKKDLVRHYQEVADTSPIGILIYNYPGAASGIDLSSDEILELSQHQNIVGVKLTCGNTGKLARIAAGCAPSTDGFLTLGGSADFIMQTLVVGGGGVIAGTANIAPKACHRVFDLYQQGKLEEARQMQAIVARGDWAAIKGGFPSVKKALVEYRGYGGVPRRPCVLPGKEKWVEYEVGFRELMALEESL
jgi:dihydrodipicolinate synthase/N-acetylneuraminate lyase